MRRALLLLAVLVLGGCSQMHAGSGVHHEADRGVQPVYLDYEFVTIRPNQMKLFACRSEKPLACQCTGRLADCVCSCPPPF